MIVWPALSLVCYGLESFPSKLEIQPIVDLEAPTVPRGLEVRMVGRNAILDWDESVDGVTGVVGYRVYRDGLMIGKVERAPFIDKDVPDGNKRYQITGVDGAGNESALSTPTVSGDLQGPGPAAGQVYSYPNPAVGGTAPVIRAQLTDADRATVKIYDVSGQLVESGELRPVPSAGSGTPYEYAWTGPIASGTYFGVVESHQSGVLTHSRLKISVVR